MEPSFFTQSRSWLAAPLAHKGLDPEPSLVAKGDQWGCTALPEVVLR